MLYPIAAELFSCYQLQVIAVSTNASISKLMWVFLCHMTHQKLHVQNEKLFLVGKSHDRSPTQRLMFGTGAFTMCRPHLNVLLRNPIRDFKI